MTKGLSRDQLGVTDVMIKAYGDMVFRLSNNHQIRRGDPVRLKDFDAIEKHRHEIGMSDGQIAARIGLNHAQVTFIRNLEERRRFHTGHYHMLNNLGGGKRFRAERMTPQLDHFRYSPDALALRAAFSFDPERVRSYVEEGLWRDDTLRKWLERQALDRPDAIALTGAGHAVTYSELKKRVERLAAGFYRAGIRPGDVVAVQLPNTREYVESFLALCWMGAVMTTLYMTYRAMEFSTQLGHAKATAAIVQESIGEFQPADTLLRLKAQLPALQAVIVVGNAPEGAIDFNDCAQGGATLPADLPEPTAADPFLLLYTSGTTSSPKGVPLNAHQMLSNARVGIEEHDIRQGDVILSAAPFGHLFALYSIQMAVGAGAAIHLLPQFSPPDFIKSVTAERPTHLFAGAAHLAACQGAGLLEKGDLSSLRLIVLSGAAVPPELVHTVAPKFVNCRMSQLWGMTETQAGVYTRPGDTLELAATSAGRASPGTEIRIADAQGNRLPDDEEGEVQVHGCSVFVGYYDNQDATASSFTGDGWFRSGDLARMDGQGNISLSGRLKEVINRGGVKYNPQEVELLIELHPAIAQCAIAPVPDALLGERACCYAVLKPGSELDLVALCNFLTSKGLAKNKLPERLEILDAMPMTATRKIIKSKLKPRDGL